MAVQQQRYSVEPRPLYPPATPEDIRLAPQADDFAHQQARRAYTLATDLFHDLESSLGRYCALQARVGWASDGPDGRLLAAALADCARTRGMAERLVHVLDLQEARHEPR